MHKLQALGEKLLTLPARDLDQLALPAELLDALQLAARLKRGEARRRQLQYIGKLMRGLDTEAVRRALDRHARTRSQERESFHALEGWRSALVRDGDAAIDRLLGICPDADRRQLRQLVRAARREQTNRSTPIAARKLFKYLRALDLPPHSE